MAQDFVPAAHYGADGSSPNVTDRTAAGQERSTPRSFVGSIDQGTTSTRFFIFDERGVPVASHQLEFKQMHPHAGWHDHDPDELVSSVQTCIDRATEQFIARGHTVADIKATGITNQRETTVLWDSETGKPLCNAIVWPDTRTSSIVRELREREGADELKRICGLPLSTYPSSVKLVWLLRNNDQVRQAYDQGRLTFGTVDSWLLFNLNGGKEANIHVTDVTNASRTMFLNLDNLDYDHRLLGFFELDRAKIKLPTVVPSSDPEAFGAIASGPLRGVRIAGCLGDQSAALVGHGAFEPGLAKNTYGTGCFLLYNVGDKPVISQHGLLATVAYSLGRGQQPVYALEGSIASAGSVIQFLKRNLNFIQRSSQISDLASTVEDNGGVVFVTAFSGLFAPYWIDNARGTIYGITQYTEKGHIARAALEATCFQTKAILDAMEKDSGRKLQQLAVDGGMSNSDLCMQIQADLINIPVDRPQMRETTALGAAMAAGHAVGIWEDQDALQQLVQVDRTNFKPAMPEDRRQQMFRKWEKAVAMATGWTDSSDVSNAGSSLG
ncbi:MAG: Glycerol kinase [Caeruleum heppii]|nr:MAG: Glycerol kinase [Caeruleum heppii]